MVYPQGALNCFQTLEFVKKLSTFNPKSFLFFNSRISIFPPLVKTEKT